MEQTKNIKLPIVGQVQHGEKLDKKVVDYGYFIAKTREEQMQEYINRFNELYKGKNSIDIQIFDENPFTIKYVRYNQSGTKCSGLEDSDEAYQKENNNTWKKISCNKFDCQYRQRNEQGKCACNRTGFLKFLLPDICKDRIWLMKITGQNSIDRLEAAFYLLKTQGIPLKGTYNLFLTQEEQLSSITLKSFKNYILNITKKEDFISKNQNPTVTEKKVELSTTNEQIVNNDNQDQPKNKTTTPKAKTPKTSKSTTKGKSTSISEETTNKSVEQSGKSKTEIVEDSIDNLYFLCGTHYEKVRDNIGNEKNYLIAELYDNDDNRMDIVINPSDNEELLGCEIGTVLKPVIKEMFGKKFAMKLNYIEKLTKNKVA